jgi:2-polyprenyl-3-methyl-5-hydroxy-6-metoxy-1,4-benzoquinol methylase
MMRNLTKQEYCHERLADTLEEATSKYDTLRRVQTLVDEFLPDDKIRGREALDVGCGLGFFSHRLQERGANVTACDIGDTLLKMTSERVGCKCDRVDALALVDYYGRDRFDVVVSSECIEHTPSPPAAVQQMAQVLKPGGYLSISTPNILWYPVVAAASRLRLRPFDGLEHFSSWRSLERTIEESGVTILRRYGLHLFPFQLPLTGVLRWCDRNLQIARGLMINICFLGQKR